MAADAARSSGSGIKDDSITKQVNVSLEVTLLFPRELGRRRVERQPAQENSRRSERQFDLTVGADELFELAEVDGEFFSGHGWLQKDGGQREESGDDCVRSPTRGAQRALDASHPPSHVRRTIVQQRSSHNMHS